MSTAKWNQEDAAELQPLIKARDASSLVVFSRDWTVETIVNQISEGNIDLEPEFQRRNAWKDDRKSRLLESFIINFPVPQIVLAENPKRRKSFLVIDGKQRLLTIAGLFLERFRHHWTLPRFRGMDVLAKLNGVAFDDFLNKSSHTDELRQLKNSDLRTTVISNAKNDNVLYDIFYRLNTGSVPLSSQELRQVLHRGSFSSHLVVATDSENPIRRVLRLKHPDARLRDVELLLRLVALDRFAASYKGNLSPFLDASLDQLNEEWTTNKSSLRRTLSTIFDATEVLLEVFGDKVGRKFKLNRWESAFNRALFEVQALNLLSDTARTAARKNRKKLVDAYCNLCSSDAEFMTSIESTTKSVENYIYRFRAYGAVFRSATGAPEYKLKM